MHILAQRKALAKGPRKFTIHGQERIAYGVTKAELKALFHEKDYNIYTRSRWRSCILEWLDEDLPYGDISTVDKSVIGNRNDERDWAIVFLMLSPEEMTRLTRAAEDSETRSWPTVEMWNDVCGC